MRLAYPLRTGDDVVTVLDRVEADHGGINLGLLLDVSHLSVNGSDLAREIATHRERIGHVQIADAPGRGARGTGRLLIADWLDDLRRGSYAGAFGLEYKADAADPFSWLPRDQRARAR